MINEIRLEGIVGKSYNRTNNVTSMGLLHETKWTDKSGKESVKKAYYDIVTFKPDSPINKCREGDRVIVKGNYRIDSRQDEETKGWIKSHKIVASEIDVVKKADPSFNKDLAANYDIVQNEVPF